MGTLPVTVAETSKCGRNFMKSTGIILGCNIYINGERERERIIALYTSL